MDKLALTLLPTFACLLLTIPQARAQQDAANITNPSQSDMLVGTRVPRFTKWAPPTPEERWRVYFRSVVLSPGAFLRSGMSAGFSHSADTPRDYGQGLQGYGKRFGNTFLTFTLQDTAGQALSAAAGYEMRYVQCKCTRFLPRIGHALKWSFVTYNKDGKQVFNWPILVGAYAVGMVSTAYTPNQKWSAEGIRSGHNAIYFGFLSNLVQEFLPDKLIPTRKAKPLPQPPPVP
jgi:hypothetical protein